MLIDKAFILAAIIFVGILCQWFAWRVKLPAILFLLFAGIIAGPLTGLLNSDALFGELLFPFISLSVAVILFEGSLTLRFHQIAGLGRVVRNLISFGVLTSWLITAAATRLVFDFPWSLALLFGAITSVTGPTVIVPMLRTVKPTAAVSNILRWEGIVIDPIGATLAVLVYKFMLASSTDHALSHTLLAFAKLVGTGLLFGSLAGYLYGNILRRHWLPEYLHNVATLGLVVFVFALSNTIQHESGLLTVTVMGIWLANMRDVSLEEILYFKESLSVLLISVLFIVLAARLDFQRFLHLGWQVVFIFLSIQFLARPLSVMISALGSQLKWPERHLLAWIAPRGIVAAAISALFAIKLEEAGYSEAGLLVPLTFSVIIGTVVLQSGTARFIAKKLGVAEPEPKGFLIIGANLVARTIGKALLQAGFRVLLVDSDWDKIKNARMDGLETYYGEPVSEHADRNLDLIGIGKLLALSPRGPLNTLSCMHYRMELGSNSVFAIQAASDLEITKKRKAISRRHWRLLFGEEVTFSSLSKVLALGNWEVRSTKLTQTFDFTAFQKQHGHGAIPFFGVTPKGSLEVFSAEAELNPQPGWTIIALVKNTEAGNSVGKA